MALQSIGDCGFRMLWDSLSLSSSSQLLYLECFALWVYPDFMYAMATRFQETLNGTRCGRAAEGTPTRTLQDFIMLYGKFFSQSDIIILLKHDWRSFIGYSNANYALSEVKDPVRTIKRAAPLAMIFVTTFYLFVNVAYFAAVSKSDILGSRRIVA
jgi:hypothetical protein